MTTTFLLRHSLRSVATIATGTCFVAGNLTDNTKKASCEAERRISCVGDIQKTTRTSTDPFRLNDEPCSDDDELPIESIGGLLDTPEASFIIAAEENFSHTGDLVVSNSSWKNQLPPVGLNCQPWLDPDNDAIVNHPIALLNASVASCDESVGQEQSVAAIDSVTPKTSTVEREEPPSVTDSEESNAKTKDKEVVDAAVADLIASPWLKSVELVFNGKMSERRHVTEIFLLGVFHSSNKSARNVKLLLDMVDPDMIFIELCNERNYILHLDSDVASNVPYDPIANMKRISKKGLSLEHSIALFFMIMMQAWFANNGSGYGGEFRVAFEYWRKKAEKGDRRCVLVLGDRPLSCTIGRMCDLDKLSDDGLDMKELYGNEHPRANKKLKELKARGTEIMNKAWEEEETWADFVVRGIMDNEALVETYLIDDDIHYPAGTEERVILQERDIYMVCKLMQLCEGIRPRRIVIIVGAAHLKGMEHLLNAGVIGTTRKPEEVLPHLLMSEKYPLDDPLLQGAVSGFDSYTSRQKK